MARNATKYQTADGERWRIVYDLPPDPETRERRQTTKRGFKTKAAAERFAREVQTEVDEGTYVAPSVASLAEYLHQWLDGLHLKATTIADYRQSADVYVIPRIGGLPLQTVAPEHLDRLYAELARSGKRDGTGLSAKSIRNVHGMLHRALGDAAKRRHIGRNPAALANPPSARSARSSNAREKMWEPEQLRRFLDATADDRLYALWHLIAMTGFRRGEALGLRWSDLDLDAGTVRVAQTVTVAANEVVWSDDGKSADSERTIRLDDETVAVLTDHRRRQLEERMKVGPAWRDDGRNAGLAFTNEVGRYLHPKHVSRLFTRAVDAIGDLPRIGVHGLRHSYATAALRAGVSPEVVSKRLGHSDVSITLSVYAHVTGRDDQDAADVTASAILGR